MPSILLASLNITEFQTIQGYSSSGLTNVKYDIKKLTMVENENFIQYNSNYPD
jgi:hypothetical protein